MDEIERRSFPMREIRADEGESPKIAGYAAVFNSLSEDLGGFREKIAPGAFEEAIEQDDVRALFNHNPDFPLGRTKAGTLRLSEDEVGLGFEIDPPDTSYAQDLMVSMRRGDVDQMSFGFSVIDDRWEKVDGEQIRTLLKVKLYDVSPVVYPAYPRTSAAVRSKLEAMQAAEAAGAEEAGKLEAARARRSLRLKKINLLKKL